MDQSKHDIDVLARINCSEFIQVIDSLGQVPLAKALDCEQPTIHRFKSDLGKIHAKSVSLMLAMGDRKIVHKDAKVMKLEDFAMYTLMLEERAKKFRKGNAGDQE